MDKVIADEARDDPNPQQAATQTHAPTSVATQTVTCSDPGSPGTGELRYYQYYRIHRILDYTGGMYKVRHT
jgi:hypothetical protein